MRKTARKRILAIVLTLCMMITLMPAALAASAEDFTDVSPQAWYYDSVDYVAEHGYFNGTDVGEFSPGKPMTRGMFVTVLARVDGAEVTDGVSPFEDVPAGMWYAGEVAWAAEQGIVLGTGSNRFAPERPVSRQEMAAFIARYLAYYTKKHNVTFRAAETGPVFQDAAEIDAYAVEAVELCRSYGLVNGDEKGCFNPKALAARAEAAAVIHRLALLLETGEENPSGGGGGGGSTSETNSAGTAAGFIEAAQKHADTVTAAVEAENSITVNDDITITNDSVRTLTLDLNNASVGNLTVNSGSAARIDIKGAAASVSSLTVNAPGATVTNGVAVNGSVEIQAVSGSTFNNMASITGNITVTGPAAVNDTQETPVPVVIATAERVIVRGKSKTITIQADGANLTLGTDAGVEPTVSSTAENVALSVATGAQTTISGTVDKLTATSNQPKLNIEGTVGMLDATSAGTLSLTGGGSVDTLTAKNTEVEIPQGSTALSVASAELTGGSLKAPDGAVDTVKAGGTVKMAASVNKVETQPDATLNLTGNKTVNTLTANGSLTLSSTGTGAAVGQIDVAADSSSQITIPENVAVSAVNNTGSGSVAVTGEGANNLTVTEKAAAPTTVGFTAPAAAGVQGTITGVDSTMEYKGASTWTEIDGTSVSVAAGTYQVRVKATDTKLASEAVTVTIPAAVAVSAASIQGLPYVGQTLTAVANADATGTLSYVWKAGTEPIPGAADKKFTLTDAQIGKTVTVSISNYSGTDAVTSDATAAVIVNKTALNKLLDKAAEVQQGVAVKDKDAAEVAEGIVFVTTAEKTALTTAINAADTVAKKIEADTAEVSGQETALREAIEAYTAAKKTGTLNEVSELQSELDTLITAATDAKVEKQDTDAANVEPDSLWVTAEVNAAYDSAINTAAAAKDKSTATADELAKAVTDLNAAMNVYQKAIRKGAALDNTALLAAINAAELNAASVSVSTEQSSNQILPSQSWVTQGEMDAYNTAITAAKNTQAAKQSENTAALAALNEATDTFNEAKKPGTKDIVPPIVTGVKAEEQSTGNAYTISFASNEAGSYSYQVGSTEGTWTAGTDFTKVNEAVTFDYTPTTPGAMLFIQVSDQSGNASVVQVKVGEEPETAEASIGSAKYATFEQALTAATSGQTVKLLKDVTLNESVLIKDGKSLTIDLNGHNIGKDVTPIIVCGGKLNITGTGKISETSEDEDALRGAVMVFGSAESSAENYSVLKVGKDVTLEGWAPVFINRTATDAANNGYGVPNTQDNACGVSIEINGTLNVRKIQSDDAGSGVYVNGSIKNKDSYPVITIGSTATINAEKGVGIYAAGYAAWTVKDGAAVTGSESGIGIKSGKLNIEGGIIRCTGEDQTPTEGFSNGINASGAALQIESNGDYAGNIEINISGGALKSDHGKSVYEYLASNKTETSVSSFAITGGTFQGGIMISEELDGSLAARPSITGGTFSEDPGAYVARDYKASKNADNTYTVAVKTEPDENDVASVGGKYFRTLQGAFDAAQDGETIQLCKDTEAEDGVKMERAGAVLTLDLAGHTYTVTNGANVNNRAFKIISGTLNVEGGGKIVAAGSGTTSENGSGAYGAFRVEAEGVLNVSGVTLENSRPFGLNVKVCGGEAALNGVTINSSYGGGIEVTESNLGERSKPGTATVTGCTFTQKNYFDHCSSALSVSGGSTLTVNSGTYTSTDGRALYMFSSGGYINVAGGTFAGGKEVIRAEIDTGTYPEYEGGLKITGGDFTGPITINSPASLSVTGGTFSDDPSAYLPDDYAAKVSGGKWTVAVRTADDSGTVASVGGRYYGTLMSAVEAAQSGDIIQLLHDAVLPGEADEYHNYDLSGKTLELNGHTLSSINAAVAFTGENAVIQNGGFVCLDGGSYALFVGNDGYTTDGFTVDGVTTTGGINIYNASGVILKNMEAQVTEVSGTNYYAVWLDENAFATIESGIYASESTKTNALLGATAAGNLQSELIINGGTFAAGKDYLSLGNGKITVHGGEFTGPVAHKPSDTEGVLSITGGTFSTNPSAYVAEGYTAEQADSGNWTVKAVNPAA